MRRWYIVIAGLLVTVGLGFAVPSVVSVQYEATSNVLVLPPKGLDENGQVTNPYLALGGLEGIADVVCKALIDRGAAEAMAATGRTDEYTMIRDPAAAAPVILITVKGGSSEGVLSTQQYLLDRIPETLRTIQQRSSVRTNAYITSTVITQDSTAAVISKGQTRALMIAVVGGLGLTLFAAALVDGLLRSRGGRPQLSRVLAKKRGASGGDGGAPSAGTSWAEAPAPPAPAPQPAGPPPAPATAPAPVSKNVTHTNGAPAKAVPAKQGQAVHPTVVTPTNGHRRPEQMPEGDSRKKDVAWW